jgi:hypothetical protein
MDQVEKIELWISIVFIVLYMIHLHVSLKYKKPLMNNITLFVILIVILKNIYDHINTKDRRAFLVVYIIAFILLFDIAYLRINGYRMF